MRVVVGLSLLVSLLSGCADPEPAAVPVLDDDAVASPDGRDLRVNLTATDPLPAPSWSVGDWFGIHLFFGASDTQGIHYNTVVVEETASQFILATDNSNLAKEEAVWDFPIVGPFEKSNLATTGFGGQWKLYDFPLVGGKTWASTVALGEGFTVDLTFTAVFNGAIDTPDGVRPGYQITALDPNGTLTLEYDYVPALGWFTSFILHDITTEATGDVLVRARSMGSGQGWSGQYFRDTATVLTEHFNLLVPAAADPSLLQPNPHGTFVVPDDATYLYGFAFSFSQAGAHETLLVDPNGETHEFQTSGAEEAGAEAYFDEAAMPGEWQIVTAGAGAAVGGGVFMWSIKETSGTL